MSQTSRSLVIQKMPRYAFEKDIFFLRPKNKAPSSDLPWYDCVPVGKNKLSTMVRDICSEGGINKKTNIVYGPQGLQLYSMLASQKK